MPFRIAKFFLYAAPFAIALVTTTTLFPFIVGKYAWFRAMTDLSLIFFALGVMFSPGGMAYVERLKRLFRQPVVIAVSVFALVYVLACFFGVRPSFSFWSNFERGEGGIQILNLYIYFLLLVTLFKEEKEWRKLFWCSLITAVLMILYGVIAGICWPSTTPGQCGTVTIGGWGGIGSKFGTPGFRFSGSLGNAEYVSGYLIFIMFFATYLMLGVRRSLRSKRSIGIAALMLLYLAFTLMSGTRGVFLGLIGGALFALAYIGWYRPRWRKWLIGVAIVGIVLVAGLVQLRDHPWVQKIPGSALLRISLHESDLTTRYVMWGIALQGVKDRPLFGWGPENFLILFDKHYDIRYFNPADGFGAWFDRAHSIIFDYLAETGILGLASYLAIFVCLGWLLLRRTADEAARGEPRRMLLQAFFLGILVTYLIQGLVLFDVLDLYLPLFTLFAFAVWFFDPAIALPGRDHRHPSHA